ncbi:MAG: FAD:protein FMN transferase [Lachnospiraceae bacterium]|nr:FAD:protein FMN transferase [Lachnospiraceae bacterium]
MNNKRLTNLVIGIVFILAIIGAIFLGSFLGKKIVSPKEVATPQEMQKFTTSFIDIFDTRTEILGYAESEEEFNKMVDHIKERLIIYNNYYDIYNDYEGINNVKTINDNAGIAPVKVDPEIIDLIEFSKDMYYETDGRVNVAMGSVLKIWHRYREAGSHDPDEAELPRLEDLQEAAKHTNIEDVIIDREAGTVFLRDPEMSLDVGSTGKGYACQKVMDYLRAEGYDHLLLSLGGNISGIGYRIDGSNFNIAIQNPDLYSDEPYIESVHIDDGQCVVSSGDYQRYYIVDDTVYCHIINPDTLFPANTFAAVSIVTNDSGKADALSTAVYNMTYEEGRAFVDSQPDVEAMWVYHDGTKVYSEGFKK